MRLFPSLSKRSKPSGRIAVVYWDRENIYFAIVLPKSDNLAAIASGVVPYGGHPSPIAALGHHLAEKELQAQNLVVLLSRADIDVLALSLPPAEQSELPAMVASEVEQQHGESETPPVVDFYVLPNVPSTDGSNADELLDVMAFALPHSRLSAIEEDAKQAGFRLLNVTIRQLASLSALDVKADGPNWPLGIAVQLYPGEVELALCHGNQPLVIRSVRVNAEDWDRAAEQLLVEVQRCMALVPPEIEQQEQQWYVDVSSEPARKLSAALKVASSAPVHEVESRLGSRASDDSPVLPSAFAGAAIQALRGTMEVDFLSPKKSPPPPNPWMRPAVWSAGGFAAASLLGWTLMSDVWQLQDNVATLQNELTEVKNVQLKLEEKSDQVALVERWLADQVDWLPALNDLSERLPEGSSATVRRLNASTDGSQAIFDLSVQVAQPEDVSILESRLRSVKYTVSSKRISQSPENSDYPWKFETRVSFPIEPIDWREYVGEDASPSDGQVASQGGSAQ